MDASGSEHGAGGRVGLLDLPLSDADKMSLMLNGYYAPQMGLGYGGFDMGYARKFGKNKAHEMALEYGQDGMGSPSYGVQYKYKW